MSFNIRSSAVYLPENIVTAEQLDERLDLTHGTCRRRYGVEKRHYSQPHETALYMGANAALEAMEAAGYTLEDMDLLIYASGTSFQALPYNAAGLLAQLGGGTGIASVDINSSCLSFLSALEYSHCLMKCQRHRRVLLVSSEVASVGIRESNVEAATLFADGAAAYILELSDDADGLITSLFRTYPEGYSLCQIRSGGSHYHPSVVGAEKLIEGSYFEMEGRKLYKYAAKLLPEFISDGLIRADLSVDDIDYIVPHQASYAGLAHISKRLGFNSDRVVDIFSSMGNQISVSIPCALHHLRTTYDIQPGQKVLLIGTAAGLSLGMGVITL